MASSGYTALSFTAGEQPTTAKWNLIGSNDASFNSGTGFNDVILQQRHFAVNSVPAAAFDASAITIGYATITADFVTSSATVVQVTNLSASVTIPSGGRAVEIMAYGYRMYQATANTAVELSIWDGAVGSGTQLSSSSGTSATANAQLPAMVYAHVPNPSAGAKTYNVGLRNVGGSNATLSALPASPAFIVVKVM